MPVEVAESFTDLGYPYYEWIVNGHGHSFDVYCYFYCTQYSDKEKHV